MGFSFRREVGLGVGLVGRGMETVRSSIIDSFFISLWGPRRSASVRVGNARGFTDAHCDFLNAGKVTVGRNQTRLKFICF